MADPVAPDPQEEPDDVGKQPDDGPNENVIPWKGGGEPKPIDPSFFEEKPESYSSRIFRGLPFKPRLDKKGRALAHDMLLIAGTVISAADDQIARLEKRIKDLQRKADLWTGPIFPPNAPAPTPGGGGGGDDATPQELGWFAKYVNLRNVIGVFIFLSGCVWTYFVFYVGEKNTDIASLKANVAMESARADRAQKDSDEFRKKYEFNDKNINSVAAAASQAVTESEGLKKQVADLAKQLKDSKDEVARGNKQITSLIETIKVANTKLPTAAPSPPANAASK